MKEIISEIKVSYEPKIKNRIKIRSSNDAYKIFSKMWDKDTVQLLEEVKFLLLNRANEVLGIYNLSKGGVSGAFVDVKLIFSIALKGNASSIILAHNHPSENLKPSKNDIDLTKKIKEGAKLLDISLLDHLIITKNSYYSFSDDLKI